jgi:hypothetical protein
MSGDAHTRRKILRVERGKEEWEREFEETFERNLRINSDLVRYNLVPFSDLGKM